MLGFGCDIKVWVFDFAQQEGKASESAVIPGGCWLPAKRPTTWLSGGSRPVVAREKGEGGRC